MKNNLLNKFFALILLVIASVNNVILAQSQSGTSNIPEPPPMQTESETFGTPASPIDMYILILAAVAIAFALYYSKRYVNQKAN